MENVKILLCPAGCGECPEVEIADDEVRIGETGNLAVLKRDEWNILVDLIQSGKLTKSERPAGQSAVSSVLRPTGPPLLILAPPSGAIVVP